MKISYIKKAWLEEIYLGYTYKIFGQMSLSSILLIREKIQKITSFIKTIPIENLLSKNKQNETILGENIIDRFKKYYLQGCKSLNLPF